MSNFKKLINHTPPSNVYCDIAQFVLRESTTTHIEQANVISDINMNGAVREYLIGFEFDGTTQELIFRGKSGSHILFLGDASEYVNKVGIIRIDMLLLLNNQLIVNTPVTFTKEKQISSFSANKSIFLNNGDKLKIMIKSDVDDLNVTMQECYVQFINLNNKLLNNVGSSLS